MSDNVDRAPAAQRTYEEWEGQKVIVAQAAVLPFRNHKGGGRMYTGLADQLLLANGEEVYICTEGDCDYGATSVQSILVGHRPRVHPEKIRRREGKINWNELATKTLAEIAEAYMRSNGDYKDLYQRFVDVQAERNQAVRDLERIRKALNQLGLSISDDEK